MKKPDGMPYTYKDIAIGADLPFFGRIIHIVDCDDFTRGFLEHEELAPSAAESYPVDPIDTYKATYKRMQTGKIQLFFSPPGSAMQNVGFFGRKLHTMVIARPGAW